MSNTFFMNEPRKISDCCGAYPRGNGDNDTEDIGICPDCGEHCEYVWEGENDEENDPLYVPNQI